MSPDSCKVPIFYVFFFFWRPSIWAWNPTEHRARISWSPRRTRSKRKSRSQRSKRWFCPLGFICSSNSLQKAFQGMSKPTALNTWTEAILDLDWGFEYRAIWSAIFGLLRLRLAIEITQEKVAQRLLSPFHLQKLCLQPRVLTSTWCNLSQFARPRLEVMYYLQPEWKILIRSRLSLWKSQLAP